MASSQDDRSIEALSPSNYRNNKTSSRYSNEQVEPNDDHHHHHHPTNNGGRKRKEPEPEFEKVETYSERRKRQNRAAQKTFRERKAKHLKKLEQKKAELKEEEVVVNNLLIDLRVKQEYLLQALTGPLRSYASVTSDGALVVKAGCDGADFPSTTQLYSDSFSLTMTGPSLTSDGFGYRPSQTLEEEPKPKKWIKSKGDG